MPLKRKGYRIICISRKTLFRSLGIGYIVFMMSFAFALAMRPEAFTYKDDTRNAQQIGMIGNEEKEDLSLQTQVPVMGTNALISSEPEGEDIPSYLNSAEVDMAQSSHPEVYDAALKGEEAKFERNRQRSKTKEELMRIIDGNSANADDVQVASANLVNIVESDRKEAEVESLMSARGYHNAVVYLDFANSTANVLIYGNKLERKDVEIIGELVTKNTGIALHKISIMDGL